MAKINLLPWREEERKERKRQFFSMTILCVILSCMMMFMIKFSIDHTIAEQGTRNSYLSSEIVVLDGQIKQIEQLEKERADLEQRMKIIQDLQQSRPLIVHLFDDLPRLLPDGLFLTEIERKDNILTIKGRTESNPRVASFMRNIENSAWLESPALGNIVADKRSSTPASDFVLTAKTKKLQSSVLDKEPAKVAKGAKK